MKKMLSDDISLQVSKEIIDMFNTKNKLIIGCRGSGKTEILKNAILLNFYTNKIKNIVVFSVNENMSYKQMICFIAFYRTFI